MSPSFERSLANELLFNSSSLWNLIFSINKISPELILLLFSITAKPVTSLEKWTFVFNSFSKIWDIGSKDNFLSYLPLGLPRWEIRIILELDIWFL